jgi:hypothetical protein
MDKESKIIYRPKSKIEKDHITVHGCGKFGDESLVMDRIEAALLYIELHKFITQK